MALHDSKYRQQAEFKTELNRRSRSSSILKTPISFSNYRMVDEQKQQPGHAVFWDPLDIFLPSGSIYGIEGNH